jgi:tRNA dimethylallyltransferase
MKPEHNLLIVTGPTASGKSALAMVLCDKLDGEIVSCDSMQIYRGCDIATAKPTPEERARIPHHLIDICDPNERFSAAQWAAQARDAISDIESRGKVPIVCGGTGFYLRALLHPQVLSEIEPDPELRELLDQELARDGALKMHEKLAGLDAAAAERLHPNDTFRVLRALEVAILTPKNQPEVVAIEPQYSARIFGIDWPREVLYMRTNERVDAMIEEDFLAELETLRDDWGRDAPALGGVGYKQMLPVLDDFEVFDKCVEDWKRDTRRYAKRQMTWFRHQLDVTWLDPALRTDQMAKLILG